LDEESRRTLAAGDEAQARVSVYRTAVQSGALKDAVGDPHQPVNLHVATEKHGQHDAAHSSM